MSIAYPKKKKGRKKVAKPAALACHSPLKNRRLFPQRLYTAENLTFSALHERSPGKGSVEFMLLMCLFFSSRNCLATRGMTSRRLETHRKVSSPRDACARDEVAFPLPGPCAWPRGHGGSLPPVGPNTASLTRGHLERLEVDTAGLPTSDAPTLFIKDDQQHECANSL